MSVSRGKREPYFNCSRVTGSEQKGEPLAYTDRPPRCAECVMRDRELQKTTCTNITDNLC